MDPDELRERIREIDRLQPDSVIFSQAICPSCLNPLSGDGVKVGVEFFHLECWEDRNA